MESSPESSTRGSAISLAGTVYRWEARKPDAVRPDSNFGSSSVFLPFYPSYSKVAMCLGASMVSDMGMTSRRRRAINRHIRYTLRAAPRWRSEAVSIPGTTSLGGGPPETLVLETGVLTLPTKAGVTRRDLGHISFWAEHPSKKGGVVACFAENEGVFRIASDADGTHCLVSALQTAAPTRQVTWNPAPIDHPLPRRFLDGTWPPRGMLYSLINLLVSVIFTVLFWPYWVATALAGAGIVVHCHRNSDTFKPGARTWLLFAPPVIQFIGTQILADD